MEQEDNQPYKGPNEFWNMVGYKDDGDDVSTFLLPDYEPASQVLKELTHTGTMKRVRMSKEKSEYRQIVFPNPLPANSIFKNFIPSYFSPYLPNKLMVSDKKVKDLKEVKVKFRVTGSWKEHWPLVKI